MFVIIKINKELFKLTMWNLKYHTQDAQIILQITFKVKWWSKFDEQSKLIDNLVRDWLSSKGFLQPTIKQSKAQQTFLKSHIHHAIILGTPYTVYISHLVSEPSGGQCYTVQSFVFKDLCFILFFVCVVNFLLVVSPVIG